MPSDVPVLSYMLDTNVVSELGNSTQAMAVTSQEKEIR